MATSKRITKTCPECSSKFSDFPCHADRRKFCSKACAREAAKGRRPGVHKADYPEFWIWCGIKKRCFNPRDVGYHRYGGRGVTVAPEWMNDFWAFYNYIGPRPSASHSIDRYPNNDGNYEPGNVRWATPSEQGKNTCRNHRLEHNGEVRLVSDWSELTGIPYRTILARLRSGWAAGRALTERPGVFGERYNKVTSRKVSFLGKVKCISEWAKITGLSLHVIRYRLNAGWDVSAALTTPKQGYDKREVSR